MINPRPYLKRLSKAEDELDKRLKDYLKDGNEDNVHDLRTTIRRMLVTADLLPKEIRKRKRSKRYLGDAEKLLKLNAKVRDTDIILTKLTGHEEYQSLLNESKLARESELKRAIILARSVKGKRGFSLHANDLDGSEVRRRFKKKVRKLIAEIEQLLKHVLDDPVDREALHQLREEARTLRYTLELDDNSFASDFVPILESWQEMLGNIHDSDIFIMHFEKANRRGSGSIVVTDVLASEKRLRKQNYERFSSLAKERPLNYQLFS